MCLALSLSKLSLSFTLVVPILAVMEYAAKIICVSSHFLAFFIGSTSLLSYIYSLKLLYALADSNSTYIDYTTRYRGACEVELLQIHLGNKVFHR